MRTIKFRGKRIDNGEWVYGYYARLRNEFKEWHCIMTEKDASENYIKDCNGYNMLYTPVNHNTVGQFTGLYDKNGEEIYEGDILALHETDNIVTHCPVSMNCKGYWSIDFGINYGAYLGLVDKKRVEIIGNIHDNPELQKGGEK